MKFEGFDVRFRDFGINLQQAYFDVMNRIVDIRYIAKDRIGKWYENVVIACDERSVVCRYEDAMHEMCFIILREKMFFSDCAVEADRWSFETNCRRMLEMREDLVRKIGI